MVALHRDSTCDMAGHGRALMEGVRVSGTDCDDDIACSP
jgi:hypothetical protein